jgi:hypothetical protein
VYRLFSEPTILIVYCAHEFRLIVPKLTENVPLTVAVTFFFHESPVVVLDREIVSFSRFLKFFPFTTTSVANAIEAVGLGGFTTATVFERADARLAATTSPSTPSKTTVETRCLKLKLPSPSVRRFR